jgi:hypothetical protein
MQTREDKYQIRKVHPFLGKHHTKESNEKNRISHLGKIAWNRGKPWSKQIKEKFRLSHLGKHHTKETGLKMGLSRKGSNNPYWKGGITSADKIEREKFVHTMQKRVFERDNYTCQFCGERGGYLQVDHIQSWAEYIELRFSMDNCRTLCMDCHYFITFNKPKPKNVIWGHNLTRRTIL